MRWLEVQRRAGIPFEPLSQGCALHAVQVAYPLAPAGHKLVDAAPLLGLNPPDDAHAAYSDATAAARTSDDCFLNVDLEEGASSSD